MGSNIDNGDVLCDIWPNTNKDTDQAVFHFIDIC